MSPEDVRVALDAIRAASNDSEAAHGLEDQLWAKVLRAIADGTENASQLASMALETQALDFSRWCA